VIHDFTTTIESYFSGLGLLAGKLSISMLALAALWHLVDWHVDRRKRKSEDELSANELAFAANGNATYLVWRIGLMVALSLALIPTMMGSDDSWYNQLGWGAGESLMFVALMFGAIFVVDRICLGRHDNLGAVLDGNLAVALIDSAFFIAFGLGLWGMRDGSAEDTSDGLLAAGGFGLLGFGVIIGVFWLHEWRTPYHLRNEIKANNVTAAFEASGMLIATAIAVRTGIAGDFTTWGAAFAGFSVTVVIALAALYIGRWVVDLLIMIGGRTVKSVQEKHETGAAAFQAVMFIVVAVLLSVGVVGNL